MSNSLEIGRLFEPLTGRHMGGTDCRVAAARQAARLREMGLQSGGRVLVHYGNNLEFFVDLLAVWLAGGCCVPVDPRLSAFEVEILARTAKPSLSLWDSTPEPAVAASLAALHVPAIDRSSMAVKDSEVATRVAPLPDDADALILFTSGTTGDPKGVVHTHGSLRARWSRQREFLGTEVIERTLCMLPTNFAWGLIGNALYTWLSGKDLYVVPAFRSDVVLRLGSLCDDHQITYLPTVPAMWRLALRMVAPPTSGSLRRVACGTSALPADLWREIQRWAGTDDVMNVYSMTECGMLAVQSAAESAPEDGLVGRPFPGVEIKLVPIDTPPAAIAVAPDSGTDILGLVCARTPSLMRGYFERPDLTAKVVNDGWFLTGDLGSRDRSGRLYLRGREKEMISIGGVKVYPGDVDAVIEKCPGVLDVCTFGEPDALQGEQVAVALVLAPGSEPTVEAIYAEAAERLAAYQVPRRWYRLDAIPRTPRGKLNRSVVARACSGAEALQPRPPRAAVTGTATE